jgi:ADP-heptose:LPS heptosyltransferase
MMAATPLQRILVIRRDNIGDLVCTTPLLRALRHQLPAARIEVLATRYNQAVLNNNPDIDALHFYVKAKHREPGESVPGIYWRRFRMLMQLRRRRFDMAIIAGGYSASAMRLARWIKPGRIVLLREGDALAGANEVENCCRLLTQVGLDYEAPPPCVCTDVTEVAGLRKKFGIGDAGQLVGIHISARKPSQRWPAEHFADLMRKLHAAAPEMRFVLLWAPGSEANPQHPGDDEKAQSVLEQTAGLPVFPVPTQRLEELIAALSLCDAVVCADGGAMHLAAGLGKPIVCFFGQSDATRWHPWGVPYELLQPDNLDVSTLPVADVLAAFERLMARGK